jgi:hypothetical protein
MPIDFVRRICADPAGFLACNIVGYLGQAPDGGDQPMAAATFVIHPDGNGQTAHDGTDPKGHVLTIPHGGARAAGGRYMIKVDNFNGGPLPPPDSEPFEAVWSGHAASGARVCHLPASGGPDVMVAPALTGCTVTWRRNADKTACFGHYRRKHPDDANSLGAPQESDLDRPMLSGERCSRSARGQAPEAQSKRTTANAFAVRGKDGWNLWIQYIETMTTLGEGADGPSRIRAVERLPPTVWQSLDPF